MKRFFFIFASCLLFCSGLLAQSGQAYELEWGTAGQVLQYHSCGCADSCWVAELKDKKTGKVLTRLRCDCEQMFVLRPRAKKEVLYKKSCDAFNKDDKFKRISTEIGKIKGR